MKPMDDTMAKIAGKGFGGSLLSFALWLGSMAQVREWLQLTALVLSIGVAVWTIISLRNAAYKSHAEEERAKAETALLNAERAEIMSELCETCRSGKVPVQCPLTPEKRHDDCPRKDA